MFYFCKPTNRVLRETYTLEKESFYGGEIVINKKPVSFIKNLMYGLSFVQVVIKHYKTVQFQIKYTKLIEFKVLNKIR